MFFHADPFKIIILRSTSQFFTKIVETYLNFFFVSKKCFSSSAVNFLVIIIPLPHQPGPETTIWSLKSCNVFEPWTATGSDLFSLFPCLEREKKNLIVISTKCTAHRWLSWLSTCCYAGCRKFNSGWTNTQGL